MDFLHDTVRDHDRGGGGFLETSAELGPVRVSAYVTHLHSVSFIAK